MIARDNRYCCRLIQEANLVYLDLCGQSNLPGYGGQGRGAQGQGCEVAIWVGENQAKKEKKRMPWAALVRLLDLWIGLIKNEDFVFGDFVLKSYGSNSISKDILRDDDFPWLKSCTIQGNLVNVELDFLFNMHPHVWHHNQTRGPQ
jgi:hypothetical protein